jgi:broad specificity phosphatase PhoE
MNIDNNNNMKIYLIRHGETTGDVEDRYGGDYDDHLTDKGKQQVKELSKKLKNKGIEIIYHSPKIRAKETAKLLSETLNVKLKAIKDLRERNGYGILTGLTKKEAKQKYPKEVEELNKIKIYYKVKGSEDYELFKKRVITAFEKILNSEHNTIAIVSHGGPISCIAREILKIGEFKHVGDCAFLEIEKKKDKLEVLNLNNASLN